MSKKGKSAAQAAEDSGVIMVLTNERTPQKANMLLMLYKAASVGQLAYMDGMDPDTGEITPLLVGLEYNESGQYDVYPLAKLFHKDLGNITNYLVPDGKGNYIDYRPKPDDGAIAEPVLDAGELGGGDSNNVQLTEIPEGLEEREASGPAKEDNAGSDPHGGALGGSPDPAVL